MVPSLWLEGKIDIIRQYNECDALTTYLLWLRVALVSGLIDLEQYNKEEELVKDVIHSLSQPHLTDYLREWKRLTTNSGTVN
jgi:predicted PolB exonuclease-like 3'-5' exonuclease